MGLDCLSGYELGGTEVCLFAIKWKTVEIADEIWYSLVVLGTFYKQNKTGYTT